MQFVNEFFKISCVLENFVDKITKKEYDFNQQFMEKNNNDT